MGYTWTPDDAWETFIHQEQLEFLADTHPPTWVPAIMKSIEVRQDVLRIELVFLVSTTALLVAYGDTSVEVTGLDQICNRLRPKEQECDS